MKRFLAALTIVFTPLAVVAQPVQVEGMRVWASPDSTRVVFDASGPLEHSLFTLKAPDRVVVDIEHAELRGSLPNVAGNSDLLHGVRSGTRERDGLRLVLDLEAAAEPRSFVLQPNDKYGHRLVIDLKHPGADGRVTAAAPSPGELRELVIAIDPGHGGEDPGAIGPSGVREKDVVLQIARRLARLIDQEYGMRAVMTRDGDYYVRHHERIERARKARADLYISIHADSFHDRRAHGSSVYVLSERGASDEAARWLAERQNASDLIGGVRLDDKDDQLASVLLDLSQTGSMGASRVFGTRMLEEIRGVNRLHKREVQAARFAMLKAPDVPSILVETAFISNPAEEARLRDPSWQQSLAFAMLNGVRGYFEGHAPPGTLVAANGIGGGATKHVISRGETLSGIAQRYNTSVQALRTSNNISSDRIMVGQTLVIPSS